jgi:ferredoxin
MKIPEVELSDCSRCGVCVDLCPAVFQMSDAGFIRVADLSEYPEAEVDEAVKHCPEDCISWQSFAVCHDEDHQGRLRQVHAANKNQSCIGSCPGEDG